MAAFGERTGVTSNAPPRRYLWTDAFALCNYLALHRHTQQPQWQLAARALIYQVHHVLGRQRPDDARRGWISGLAEAEGERHPTAGGLRIGKPLPERQSHERVNDRIDWDRDGQYHHYLTRWMHALARTSSAWGEAEPLRWGIELARATHEAFAWAAGAEKRLYWKMSVDLTQPVVRSMGDHDALDGLISAAELWQQGQRNSTADSPDLQRELNELAAMCANRGWSTTDALGLGLLMSDALFLARLTDVPQISDRLFARILTDAARSLDLVATNSYMRGPAQERLAFRELGLSIGLAAVQRLAEIRRTTGLPGGSEVETALERLLRHLPLRERIESFWLDSAHQGVHTWMEHEDINAVMLATSILPDGYLD